MKNRSISFWTALTVAALLAATVNAKEMRADHLRAQQAREQLLKKAEEEKKAALAAEAESRTKILSDRNALMHAISELKARTATLKKETDMLAGEAEALTAKEKELTGQIAEMDATLRELVGVVRVFAKDMGALIKQNPQSALIQPQHEAVWEKVAGQDFFPGMTDIRAMTDRLFNEIRASGEVSLSRSAMVDRGGKKITADILMLGSFTAAYASKEETGFLNYSSSSGNLFALTRLPSKGIQKELARYIEGESDTVTMDISRGGALRQLTHRLSLWEQIPKGGIIVWPILMILVIGSAIVIERVLFLMSSRMDADGLIRNIAAATMNNAWTDCGEICREHRKHPVARVVAAGLACCQMAREELENALQEAILREIPPLERFISTLAMLAAIAPLLGLLGTVTGMIDTFNVITQHGTSDPRLMSGGISEALVTTMLGLSVAIPIMLAHTLLNRAVEMRIGEMEEKAVAFVNLIHKSRQAS